MEYRLFPETLPPLELVRDNRTAKEKHLFSQMNAAEAPTPNYNSRRAPGLPHWGPTPCCDPSERMRAASSAASRSAETGRGSQALVGTVPPSDRSPRFLFGPLTSNEERAGRKGRGCGGAGPARRAGGRGWRGHVTASLASGQGGGALPGSSSPPARAAARKQLPAHKQQLRAHPHQLAPRSRTCDLLLLTSSLLSPAQPGPA